MQPAEAQARIAQFPLHDPAAALGAGLALLKGDFPERLLPLARDLAQRHPTSAKAHQLLGLAARACGESVIAYEAFRAAAALAPGDALIAHSHARTALEAGLPAAALFAAAAPLAPQDGTVLIGHATALFAEGQPEAGIAMLIRLTAANPLWLDGHRSFAALSGQMGGDPLASTAAALDRTPRSPELHHCGIAIALQARDLPRAAAACAAAEAALGPQRWISLMAGHIASESGALDAADTHFAAAGPPDNASEAWMHARHHLRRARPEAAAAELEPRLADPGALALWPYLSLAWRMMDDPRAAWLEGDPRLVGVYDIGLSPAELAALADHLRSLHRATADPLDQSVRGGTQTDGNLLLRAEAPIRDLRARLLAVVERHVAQLPAPEPGHPTLLAGRTPLRVAGAWSVRLTDAGHHTDHVHPQGWFSSALYLALPETLGHGGEDHAGWLGLGEARDLVPGLAPYRLVEPKPGRLVLFPSTMWHGTRPFPKGERLTVAFDIARPRQD
ncbi:putative 2OG-Fe(II) oxygenase [Erythrobacter sp. BLCC-B19]|uniref:putative 2OG-Fe(II) oxygenase n=1 Tax=Erythrobacter sp. BLCC-B19 TaxID=3025315 RepID=UPI0023601F56|nr:putative 2OG-Fe(II) oxygenase [Erythrobacter sp. BLCC-B19]WDA39887.1 putative 2OG-Fe(II) oxygenase [Erythrobacter sp. BLCC-B19]